jgi:hypothetical protein
MEKYNHQVGLKMVGEMLPNENERVTLNDEADQYGLKVARVTYSWGENDKALIQHALGQMQTSLELVGAKDIFRQEDDTNHLAGTARIGFDAQTSVVDSDCRSWDIPNLWVCDGSVFSTQGRCQSVTDHNGDCHARGRSNQGFGGAGRALILTRSKTVASLLQVHVHKRARNHHVGIQVIHYPKRSSDNDSDDQNTEGQCQDVVGVVGPGGDM